MSNEAPTDALRLVPIDMQIESILHDLVEEVSAAQRGARVKARARQCCARGAAKNALLNLLAAAPASPLPGGGWKPSRNDVARRCDPKAWEFYDRHIDNPIMGAECRAEVAASIRMADAILALPAAPTGEPK